MKACNQKRASRQRGVALPVIMILMIVILVLASAGMEDTLMQERMSGNLRDREAAFQAAEAALRGGEVWAQNNQGTAIANPDLTQAAAVTWDAAAPAPSGVRTNLYPASSEIQLESDPVFYVGPPKLLAPNPVELGSVAEPPRRLYPVTARGVGGSEKAVVVLRSVFWANTQ